MPVHLVPLGPRAWIPAARARSSIVLVNGARRELAVVGHANRHAPVPVPRRPALLSSPACRAGGCPATYPVATDGSDILGGRFREVSARSIVLYLVVPSGPVQRNHTGGVNR